MRTSWVIDSASRSMQRRLEKVKDIWARHCAHFGAVSAAGMCNVDRLPVGREVVRKS